MAKYKFKDPIKEKNKNEAVIEKTDFSVEFTLNDMNVSRRRGTKVLEELEALRNLRDAEAKNIAAHHRFVLSAIKHQNKVFRAQTLALYVDKLREIKEIDEKMKPLQEAIAEHDEELIEIKKQLGIEALPEAEVEVQAEINEEQNGGQE